MRLPACLLLAAAVALVTAPAAGAATVRPGGVAKVTVRGPGTITGMTVRACARPSARPGASSPSSAAGRAHRAGVRATPARRGATPRPRLRVRLDGAVVARLPVRSGVRRAALAVPVGAGRHELAFAVTGVRCGRAVRVGDLRWSRPPAAPPAVPAPVATTHAAVAAPAPPPAAAAAAPAGRIVPLGTALAWPLARDDAAYRAALVASYASVTPENAMKMEWLQPRPGVFDFRAADELVAFARDHELAVRGHTLIWGNQLPWWMTRFGPAMSAAEMEARLREHVTTVMEHFRGRVRVWDVVNEAIADDGSWRRNVWLDVLGPGYVETAFRAAREADPDVALVYNEIAAETPGPKQDAMVALVARLREQGLIDGVGLQLHTTVEGAPAPSALVAAMRRFEALGVGVEITEADVDARNVPAPERAARQAAVYRGAAAACRAVAACSRFTVWGVGDGVSWQGPGADALLLDAAFAPKPALAAVREALGG